MARERPCDIHADVSNLKIYSAKLWQPWMNELDCTHARVPRVIGGELHSRLIANR